MHITEKIKRLEWNLIRIDGVENGSNNSADNIADKQDGDLVV